ncbi:MAG: TetR/AcrR family transcriptional regulator [Candidatus Binataceae bacterium]
MVVKSRKQKNAEATRKALLRVSRKLFAERGYANTFTEDVVKRARVTRGALYHHFRDKQDLFKAVFHEEEQKLALKIAQAAAIMPDTWSGFVAGCQAFLDACLDPVVRQIILIDGPSVFGVKGHREVEESYYLTGVKKALAAGMDAGVIEIQPIDPLAHILLGALNEAALVIANANDEDAARDEAGAVIARILEGLKTAAGPACPVKSGGAE